MDLWNIIEENWFNISTLIAMLTFIWKISMAINKHTTTIDKKFTDLQTSSDKKDEEIYQQISDLNKKFHDSHAKILSQLEESEKHRIEGTERTRIIMNGVEATLVTLHNSGANGPVTKSLDEISEYKSRKAAE